MSSTTSCEPRQTYIARARDNIENLLFDALNDVKETLNGSADFRVQQSGLFNYSDYGLPQTLYPGSMRIKEFGPILFDALFARGFRGNYHLNSGRIFLRQGTWCRQCLIHETLHSVSVFALPRNIQIGYRYLFLREGLTEILTGYVLWRKYPHCYESWRRKIFPHWCAPSPGYEEMARIWFTFSRFIDFENTKQLYFGNGVLDWSNLWNRFLGEIHKVGFPNFRDPIAGSIGRFQDRFLEQCKINFGRAEVERILEVESYDFEYGNVDCWLGSCFAKLHPLFT